MKCPKCEYLGFDTGERCRNCGYDFSLMTAPDPMPDLDLRSEVDSINAPEWLGAMDKALGDRRTPDAAEPLEMATPAIVESVVRPAVPAAAATVATPTVSAAAVALDLEPTLPPPSFRGAPSLPLFSSDPATADEPLIKVPAQPRPPLAVRRTPETPRLRAVPKAVERLMPEPVLEFSEETPPSVEAPSRTQRSDSRSPQRDASPLQASGSGARVVAVIVDHAILFTIDAIVLYLTLRVAALTMADWRSLPMLPMATFLGLLKLAYFTAFTCVGGQTIGKMAAGIRVVGDDQRGLSATHALHRALAGALSFLTLGLGFLPALLTADRRALHDRLARTRVVIDHA
jgi:uncharacterized RDD family membrane protein YckC